MKAIIWLYLSWKRYLIRPSFLLLLILLPAGAWLFRREEKADKSGIPIAVFAESKEAGSLEQKLLEKLVHYRDESEGMFSFYSVSGIEELKEEVAARRAECGYVILEGLKEKLDRKQYRDVFVLYQAPSTVAGELSTETFFSLMIEEYDRLLFLDYMESFAPGGGGKEAESLYQAYLNDGSTFRFVYEEEGKARQPGEETAGPTIFPIRGFLAVIIFVTGLYGAVTLGRDEKQGLFLMLPPGQRLFCRLAVLAAPVFLTALSGFAALWLSGEMGLWYREAGIMLVYLLETALFSMAAKAIIRKEELLCCLLPLFFLGSLIFCPVFLDVGRYIKAAGTIEKLFLPYYYLKWF